MRGESLDPTLWIWDRKWSLTLYRDSQLLANIFSIIFNDTRLFCYIDCRLLNQPCPTNTSSLSPQATQVKPSPRLRLRPHSFTLWRSKWNVQASIPLLHCIAVTVHRILQPQRRPSQGTVHSSVGPPESKRKKSHHPIRSIRGCRVSCLGTPV